MASSRPVVEGVGLDPWARCTHYHSPLDIVAIRMACCRIYYACKDCHEELADHPLTDWPREQWSDAAVLCGACGHEMTITDYLESGSRCPACDAAFNPACRNHHHFYFAT